MKNLIGLLLFVALIGGGISCRDINVYPTTTIYLADTVKVDPDIEKYASFMTATWRCTKTSFTPTYDWIDHATIDCTKEKQFAFLKEMNVTKTNVSGVLKVENTYLCSAAKTTYFYLDKMACCGFTITERDELNQVIRVFNFIAPNGQSIWNDVLLKEEGLLGTTLYIRTYDLNTFDLNSPGSLTSLPSIYMIFVEKNF